LKKVQSFSDTVYIETMCDVAVILSPQELDLKF
jgi:hypothetical protein